MCEIYRIKDGPNTKHRTFAALVEENKVFIANNKSKEPALKVGAATGTLAGLVSLLLYFFPNQFSDKNAELLLVFLSFLLPIVTAAFTRDKVWSPATVQETLDTAVEAAKEQIQPKPYRSNISDRLPKDFQA